MIERFKQDHLCWVRMENPSGDEIHSVIEEFNVPPALMSDFAGMVPHSGCTMEDEFIRVTMYFPVVKRRDIDHPHEIKFVITKHALLTAQYEDMEAMDRFRKEFEVITTLRKASGETTGAHLFIALVTQFYDVIDSKLDYMESKLASIETDIFSGKEKDMVFALSEVSKSMIAFRQAMKSHDEIIRDIRPLVEILFGDELTEEFRDLHSHYFIIIRRMNSIFETFDDLRDTNMALLTTKQNETMRVLTIMAFVTFPLTLFASLFGMNTKTLPLTGYHGDFWVIIGIMSFAAICFFSYFKYKKWL